MPLPAFVQNLISTPAQVQTVPDSIAKQAGMVREIPIEDKLWMAFGEAETGSFDDPWIRTTFAPKGGSTAFGPVQITRSKVKDYNKRGLISKESSDFYSNVLEPMYKNFIKYGREPNKEGYLKEYDYGGGGFFDVENFADEYEDLAKEMLMADYKQAQGDIDELIRLWRGKSDDQRYNKVIKEQLKGE